MVSRKTKSFMKLLGTNILITSIVFLGVLAFTVILIAFLLVMSWIYLKLGAFITIMLLVLIIATAMTMIDIKYRRR